jgi:hypothetical protein
MPTRELPVPAAPAEPLTIDQHFAALAEMLLDEPDVALQDRLDTFVHALRSARRVHAGPRESGSGLTQTP